MEDKFCINPFDRSALTDFRQLAGRSGEFRQIRFILRSAAKNQHRIKSILLIGERGVGKTSILNLIEAECGTNNIIPIRIDLTEANSSTSNDFFWHLFNQSINMLFNLGIFEGKGGAIDCMIQSILNFKDISDPVNWVFKTPILRRNYIKNSDASFEFHSFIDDIRLMRKEVHQSNSGKSNSCTKFLFLVDEAQHLYSNKKLIEEIRYVIQSQDLGVGFVFAGDSSYKASKWEEVFGGSYRDFEIINLPYFDDVESVEDFFMKSLASVNWTEEEVEEKLFYRFKVACRNIFKLTSGKPAWINTIASKMFERCMSGEVKQLKFDKQAQSNVKRILEDSGEIDISKISFIESLSTKMELWLGEIFASELHTFRQVYFFAKFKLTGENGLSLIEFEQFCRELVSRQIITLFDRETSNSIRVKSEDGIVDFLDSHYYAFNLNSDTTKQWLQISSDGKFIFKFQPPDIRFSNYINEELVVEKFNTVIIASSFGVSNNSFRLSDIIKKIENQEFDVSEETYESLKTLYKACKKLEESSTKQVLYVVLEDQMTGKSISWNIYNYNDKDKIIGFRESPSTLTRLGNLVDRYYNEKEQYNLKISIDKISNQVLNVLQRLIINSGDTKKVGIILQAKLSDLIRLYVKESNVESSYEIAEFFYKLFEEGHDLGLKDLNNSAYVFIEKNQTDKAIELLNEAKRKINAHNIFKEDQFAACLVNYNLAIVEVKNANLKSACNLFEDLNDFIEQNEVTDGSASVMKYLKQNNGKIEIDEAKEGTKSNKLLIKDFTAQNLELLKEHLSKSLIE